MKWCLRSRRLIGRLLYGAALAVLGLLAARARTRPDATEPGSGGAGPAAASRQVHSSGAANAFALDTHLAWRMVTGFRKTWSLETRGTWDLTAGGGPGISAVGPCAA